MKALAILIGTLAISACSPVKQTVPASPEAIQPLSVGSMAPNVLLKTPEGTVFSLKAATMKTPTVLIFYRGGWCPFCNRHLADLQQITDELLLSGIQILAVSPDRPGKLADSTQNDGLNYQLLSDSSMAAGRAFGIAFTLDDATVKKYKEEYKIDIEADSGETHHQLPVPAVFLIEAGGKIAFAHTNPDYKVRLSGEQILEAARRL